MSLINEMLKDLETRKSAPSGDQSAEHLYRDLRPVRRRRRPYRALALSVGVILAVTATTTLLFASGHWDSSLLPTRIAQWAGAAGQDADPISVVQVKYEDVKPAKVVTTTVEPSQTASVVDASLPTTSTQTADTLVAQASLAKQHSEPVKVEANAKAVTKKKPEIEAKATTKIKTKTATKTAAQKKKPKKELTRKKVVPEEKERLAAIQPKVMVALAKPSMAASSLNAVSEEEMPAEMSERGVVERTLRTLTAADQAEEAFRESVQSLQQNRVDEAQEKLRFAVATDPQHVEARELLAGLLMRRGGLVEAEPLLNDGLATNPEHYPFAQLLARIHIQRGAGDKALALLERVQPYAKTDAEFFGFMAALYQRAGQHENAIKAYSRAVTINPQQSQWWLGMGISLEAKSNWNAAHQAYRRAIAGRGLSDKLGRYARERLASVQRKVASSN